MKVKHNDNAIFIHIPKTGGSSLLRLMGLRDSKPGEHVPHILQNIWYPGHSRVSKLPLEEKESRFVFSFTRNPYARLVSAHAYITDDKQVPGDYQPCVSGSFEIFVKEQLEEMHKIGERYSMHLRPMTGWLDQEIDFVGKLENYQDDLNHVCDMIGQPRCLLPHRNVTKHKHYTEYYDDETREIVEEIYKEDFERFNYGKHDMS